MICPRHHAIATHQEHGRAYCARCFREARQVAEDMTLEALVRRLRGTK